MVVKKKIRVMHVAQPAGGVDRYLRMLLKYLDKQRIENIVVLSQDFHREDYKELADFYETVEMQRAIGVQDLKAIYQVRKLIKKYCPDVVYAHSSKAGAIARVADIGMSNRCIYNPHGWAFNMKTSSKTQKMYTMIEKMAALFCDMIICISDAEKKSALEKRICKEEKLQVIFNGVDIDAYEEAEHGLIKRTTLGIPDDAFVVGMVGRLCKQKAPDVFVKAAKLIKQDIPSVHFIIVGNGEMEAEVRKYAEENGLSDSLHITGWVENPMSYVELFDVACLVSRWEGFGLALPEYMLAGKPIVATRVDAIPDIIKDGENGLLVEVDDITGIYMAIMRLNQNMKVRDALISKAKQSVIRFDAKRVSAEHQELFEKM
ncbi:MAG: glycosyltransferase family 4 protein [Eubacteriales bacterium]|nr:glycosyltransferase family 4 protein [Eubacteriales bacterium]